jgi:sulfatase modifying factor 1
MYNSRLPIQPSICFWPRNSTGRRNRWTIRKNHRRLDITICLVLLLGLCNVTVHAGADTFGSGANQFTIDFVTIGNPGNPADTGNPNPAGSVAYVYNMGKYEVSRDMITKANSAGGLQITLADMSFVTSGPRPDMPATGVSWNEAARFVNWLNTIQGYQAAYKFSTQPGDGDYDANANIDLWQAGDPGFDAANPFRNTLAHYFLPSVDEWYKAAYYDPSSGIYFVYPTGSDTEPSPVAGGTAAGTAVYVQSFEQGPADITQAGGLSPYGTMGQGGNVFELEETEFDLINDDGSSVRHVRGGYWESLYSGVLASGAGNGSDPLFEDDVSGFRVASVPEASSLLLMAAGAVWFLARRWPNVKAKSQGISFLVVLLLTLSIARRSAMAVTIETVPVGNPGNAGDLQSFGTFGSVAYLYRIGQYEVSNAQYVEFLNGVDPTGANTLALYNGAMSSFAGGGIIFSSGAANGSKYSVKPSRDNNPVVLVSWYDSIRFANWMHNGMGAGDTEDGAYTLLGGTPTPSNGSSITRNPRARWWLSSEDEWYKAAYHKNDGVTGNYWDYPTSSDTVPYSDEPPGSGAPDPSNTANFFKSDGLANGYDDGYAVTGSTSVNYAQNFLTDVGAYTSSISPYGTFDQGGNVSEWFEALFSSTFRGRLGGNWSGVSPTLHASGRGDNLPEFECDCIGFRVATIPEPANVTLLILGVLLLSCAGVTRRGESITPQH